MSAENSLVSVIVPIYKVETYLKRCVDSILSQTYKNLEIILVDDGSPDSCPQMCDDYAALDYRVKVVHKENGGLADARNAGLNVASGLFVSFIDSDDCVHEDYICKLIGALKKNDADIAIAKFFKFSSDSVEVQTSGNEQPQKMSIKNVIQSYCSLNSNVSATFISCCNKLYKRKLFETLRFPKGKLNEDAFVSYQLLANASNGIVLVDEPLYFYYIRSDSIVGSSFSKRNLDVLEAYHGAVKWFQEKNDDSLSLCFYLPLLMREIYCWWGAKYILNNSAIAENVLINYKNDCNILKNVTSVSWKWKCVFRLFFYFPWLYSLYRKFSPIHVGNR